MTPVYLDYAATTPVDKRVLEAMMPYFTQQFGNPSSVYSFGREARRAVALARCQVASLLDAEPSEIFFTSGGSESDNWVIKGMAFALRRAGKGKHIITSSIEHHAVLHTCKWLEDQGFTVTYLPVDRTGRVRLRQVCEALQSDTILVSLMTANNEVGTIEPIAEVGQILQERGIFFHTDAVQAAGHVRLAVNDLHVDALSLSGHKFYGPKGIGALYLRHGFRPDSWIHGGSQESDMRAGTENTAAIVGLGKAAELAKKELTEEGKRLSALHDWLVKELKALTGVNIHGEEQYHLPGTVNFSVQGMKHDSMLIRLDMAGFAVSAGSACSAGSLEPSHVLTAMGLSADEASSAIRVSLGRFTGKEDLLRFVGTLREIIEIIKKHTDKV